MVMDWSRIGCFWLCDGRALAVWWSCGGCSLSGGLDAALTLPVGGLPAFRSIAASEPDYSIWGEREGVYRSVLPTPRLCRLRFTFSPPPAIPLNATRRALHPTFFTTCLTSPHDPPFLSDVSRVEAKFGVCRPARVLCCLAVRFDRHCLTTIDSRFLRSGCAVCVFAPFCTALSWKTCQSRGAWEATRHSRWGRCSLCGAFLQRFL